MAVTEEITPLERKIIRQVEYYFGDFNLPKDKFLKETVKENEGWVTMETMLKFKRLADLSQDAKEILTALKKSDSGLMEIEGEADGKVRRSPSQPLPENNDEFKKQVQARTAYAKGFDLENTKMDELLEFYAEHEPTVVNIQMRNYCDRKTKVKGFKGSIFMTFRTEEDCKAFVEAEKKEYKGKELLRKLQNKYFEDKAEEFKQRREKKGKGKDKEDQNKDDENVEENTKDEMKLPKGTVVKFTGLGTDCTREDIKDKLKADFEVNIDKDTGDIAFVTYEKGETEAKVRFKVENYGKDLMEKINKVDKIVIKENEVKASLLEGEEEDQFLADSLRDLKNRRNNNKKGHKRKHHGKNEGHKKFKRN